MNEPGICPSCKEPVSGQAEKCHSCGEPFIKTDGGNVNPGVEASGKVKVGGFCAGAFTTMLILPILFLILNIIRNSIPAWNMEYYRTFWLVSFLIHIATWTMFGLWLKKTARVNIISIFILLGVIFQALGFIAYFSITDYSNLSVLGNIFIVVGGAAVYLQYISMLVAGILMLCKKDSLVPLKALGHTLIYSMGAVIVLRIIPMIVPMHFDSVGYKIIDVVSILAVNAPIIVIFITLLISRKRLTCNV